MFNVKTTIESEVRFNSDVSDLLFYCSFIVLVIWIDNQDGKLFVYMYVSIYVDRYRDISIISPHHTLCLSQNKFSRRNQLAMIYARHVNLLRLESVMHDITVYVKIT